MQRASAIDRTVKQLDKVTVIQRAKQYASLVQTVVQPHKVILYGSFAEGTWHQDSDIDIAVVVERLGEDYLSLSSKLWWLTTEVDTRIEPLLLKNGNDPSGFLEHILKHGVIVYDRDAALASSAQSALVS